MQIRRHTPDSDPDTILDTRPIIWTVTLAIDIAGFDPERLQAGQNRCRHFICATPLEARTLPAIRRRRAAAY
jgi:hypothetical protein